MKRGNLVECLFMYDMTDDNQWKAIRNAVRRNVVQLEDQYIIVRLKYGLYANRTALMGKFTVDEAQAIASDCNMKKEQYGKYALFM